jgi:hypothetical protein
LTLLLQHDVGAYACFHNERFSFSSSGSSGYCNSFWYRKLTSFAHNDMEIIVKQANGAYRCKVEETVHEGGTSVKVFELILTEQTMDGSKLG